MTNARKKSVKKDDAENIKVLVRTRPLNQKELDAGMKQAVDVDLTEGTVTVNHVCGAPDRWTFDAVMNNSYSQKDIFVTFIQPMVDSVMEGFNATIFAYGQSGSGKTYTMSGIQNSEMDLSGIIPRSFTYIFNHIKERRNPNISYSLRCSFLELYNGKIRDLLAKQQVTLQIKENKDKTFYVLDLSQPEVKFVQDMLSLMEEGTIRRQVAATELNTDSSRSHSIFTVSIQMVENLEDGECRTVTSKLNLVDLAGSERQNKTRASGETLKEGCNINLSLSALGTVIDTIVKGKGHIPFRSSPLTMLLKDSLGGNSKTCMFANINPADANISETVSTLRFADRAKQIKNKPMVQMDAKDAKIQELLTKVQELQEKMRQYESNEAPDIEEENEQLHERIATLEGDLAELHHELEARATSIEELKHQHQSVLGGLQHSVEERDEGILLLKDRLQVAGQREAEVTTEVADLKDIVVNFVVEAHPDEGHVDPALKGNVGDISLEALKEILDGLRDTLGSGVSEDAVRKEREAAEAELNTVRGELRREIARLSSLNDEAQQALVAVNEKRERLKARLEREKESRKTLEEEKRRELRELQEGLRAAKGGGGGGGEGGGTPADDWRAANTADALDNSGNFRPELKSLAVDAGGNGRGAAVATAESIELQQELALLRERVCTLQADLDSRGKEESSALQTSKEGSAKARSAQEAAEMEVSKMMQRLAEPCEGDAAVVARLKRELQLLDATRHTEREERGVLTQELLDKALSLDGERRQAEKLRAQLRELQASKEKLRGIAVQLSPRHREEVSTRAYVAQLEARIETYEATSAQRQDVLVEERGMCKKDLDRQFLKNQNLQEQNDRLIDTISKGATAEPGQEDAVDKLTEAINSQRTQLRAARIETGTLLQKESALAVDTAERKQQLLNLQSKLQEIGKEKAMRVENMQGDAAVGRIVELEARVQQGTEDLARAHHALQLVRSHHAEAGAHVAELEARLAQPAYGDAEMVSELKLELHAAAAAAKESLRESADVPAQRAEGGAGMPEAAGGGGGGGEVSAEHERVLSELKEEKREMEVEMTALSSEKQKRAEDYAALLREMEEAHSTVQVLRDDLKKTSSQAVAEERAAAKWRKERDVAVQTAGKLQQRLTEKEEALKSVRNMTETASQLLEKHKANEADLVGEVDNLKGKLAETATGFSERLQNEQAKWARYQSERIEELNAAHEQTLAKKDEDHEVLRKKLKKSQQSVQKVKERYDTKCLEAEGLRTQLENMQEVALRQLRERQNPNIDVDDSRDEINAIIRNSRAARSRALSDSPHDDDRTRERNMKKKESMENILREEKRSAASKMFDGDTDLNNASATYQASVAVRHRSQANIAKYETQTHRASERRGSGGHTAERRMSEGTDIVSPIPVPPPTPPVYDNDTQGHGIHRQLSPRMQFNPRNRQRDVEERIMAVEAETEDPNPIPDIDIQPRGPSSLNPYTRLEFPTRGHGFDGEHDDVEAPFSMGLSQGVIPEQPQEKINTSMQLPRRGLQ